MANYDEVVKEINKEFPIVKIQDKDKYWLWKVVDILLKVITIGKFRGFMTEFDTTVGWLIGLNIGNKKDEYTAEALLHEREHLRQTAIIGKYVLAVLTLGASLIAGFSQSIYLVVGTIPFSLAYLLLPVPCGFAWCRYYFERKAYTVSINLRKERGAFIDVLIPTIANNLGGVSYFWSWPKSLIIKYFQKEFPKTN